MDWSQAAAILVNVPVRRDPVFKLGLCDNSETASCAGRSEFVLSASQTRRPGSPRQRRQAAIPQVTRSGKTLSDTRRVWDLDPGDRFASFPLNENAEKDDANV